MGKPREAGAWLAPRNVLGTPLASIEASFTFGTYEPTPMSRRRRPANGPMEHAELCVRARCRRFRRKGQDRKAMLALRDACYRDESDPVLWTVYGAQCDRLGAVEEARRAFAHAIWLRERSRDFPRAAATRMALERLASKYAA